jgi:hypothetical protein
MKNFFVLLLIVCSISAYSQTNTEKNMEVKMTREAFYPEGDMALATYLFHNLKYSEEAKVNKVKGDVTISFFVELDSTLTNIKIMNDLGCGCQESLKELIGKLKYYPALVNGVPMRSNVLISVNIRAR